MLGFPHAPPDDLDGRVLVESPLVAAVAADETFAKPEAVPTGFVGATLPVPRPVNGALYLKLFDAPDDVVKVMAATKKVK